MNDQSGVLTHLRALHFAFGSLPSRYFCPCGPDCGAPGAAKCEPSVLESVRGAVGKTSNVIKPLQANKMASGATSSNFLGFSPWCVDITKYDFCNDHRPLSQVALDMTAGDSAYSRVSDKAAYCQVRRSKLNPLSVWKTNAEWMLVL